jgi:hypothetical protein
MTRATFSTLTAMALLASGAFAQDGIIELSVFPTLAVSDGRTPITVTAIVRDSSGRLVPNGTQVIFESTLGSFRESVVTTENGYARATLIAPSVPGVARIQASSIRFSAKNRLEMEFVADRSLLNSAKEFIEVIAPKSLLYSIPERTLEASGEDRGVKLVYRDIEITADDLQLDVPNYEVRARNAKVSFGKNTYEVQELAMRLNSRRGVAVAVVEVDGTRWGQAGGIILPVPVKRPRITTVEITSEGLRPVGAAIASAVFKFRDLSDTLSSVEAKKAVAYPQKDIYFYRSNVRVSGVSVMRVPLFQVSANAANPLITDQFLNVTSTQLNINYPYYLSLKPGETSLIRLRYGNRFGYSVGASAGLFMDYELKWNRGDQMEGGLTFYGLNRNDWGATVRQSLQPDSRTTVNMQLDAPAHRSLFGTFGLSRIFDGFQANLNASHGRSLLRAAPFTTENYNLLIEKDPIKMGVLPAQLFLGINAQASRFTGPIDRSQSGVGWQARMATRSIRLDPQNAFTASYRVSQFTGRQEGISQSASLGVTSQLGRRLGFFTTYDFVNDRYTSDFLGMHRVSTEAVFTDQNLSIRGFFSKSLDLDRLSTSLNSRWSLSGLWRMYYNYNFDRFLDGSFSDQSFILSYRMGFREIGLSYSQRTRRIGIEILGTSF